MTKAYENMPHEQGPQNTMTGPFLITKILEINMFQDWEIDFETLQEKTEIRTPNDEYEDFVNAHLEAATNCISTKPRTKYRVPWEKLVVREKRADVKTASKCYWKNPTNTNALKLKQR